MNPLATFVERYGLRTCFAICFLFASVCTLAIADSPPSTTERADAILILKTDHTMQLLSGGKVIRTYKVALGSGGLAPKQREGDARTPEGHYTIDSRSEHSVYHKALHVSYPDAEDRKRAAGLGVPPGGAMALS